MAVVKRLKNISQKIPNISLISGMTIVEIKSCIYYNIRVTIAAWLNCCIPDKRISRE